MAFFLLPLCAIPQRNILGIQHLISELLLFKFGYLAGFGIELFMRRYITILSVVVFLIGISCKKKNNEVFIEKSARYTGVDFINQLNETPELNILNYLYYYNGGGVAAADFNNDGLVDLYFTGNQIADEFYLNSGNLKFKKVTKISGIQNSSGWTTGVTHVDINNDGLLDIYVCKASGYRTLEGKNKLYVNQGIGEDGVPFFLEKAHDYGLDFSGLSTQAAFFDFDLDGDLDMFLMNHSVHPNRNYGRGKLRQTFDRLSGDRLFRNDNGTFADISTEAGIFQGKTGYGLGLTISDINSDGYPDIYVGNDFFENDYLYINQGDGTYKEIISQNDEKLGHTTHFSMGNDIADLNNDGLFDVVSLDMLPEDLQTYKTSGLEYAYPIYRQYLNNNYAPQFMQNTLHLNLGNDNFSEIGSISGISASEWSWSPLLADFDNDGYKDVFITNGIKGATNDMDYMNFIANEAIQKRIDAGMKESDMPLTHEIPEKKTPNYFFRNNGDLTFTNVTKEWFKIKNSFSNGAVYADLDNDGDLDIVVNNVNEPAYILENNTAKNNYLKISFSGNNQNRFGIGTKLKVYVDGNLQVSENFPTRGYLSSVSNDLHFGLAQDSIIDSIQVIWPSGKFQTITNIGLNRNIKVHENNARQYFLYDKSTSPFTAKVDSSLSFIHRDQLTLDFDREPLIPFANSNQGPTISVSDINADGFDDLFIGGAKKQASALFLQNSDGTFKAQQHNPFDAHETNEDVASCFFDANGDGWQDLLVGSGGNEFKAGSPLRPRLYLNNNGILELDSLQFQSKEINVSSISAHDFDEDSDLDVLITSDQVTSRFGETPVQFLFENDGKGNFNAVTDSIIPGLSDIGNVKDAIWQDLNNDGKLDLITVGHWMPVTVFLNHGEQFVKSENNGLENTNGWWNVVKGADFDNDGDIDLICGNWGTNSKFKASFEKPITLYNNDFDDNDRVDPIVTYFHHDTETPFASKDELVKQMPYLNKKYLSYNDFAAASLQDLFGKEKLAAAQKKKVYELQSCYFENDGSGKFVKRKLPIAAQFSVVYDMAVVDFNNDGYKDLLIVGNNFEISTQLGRLDAFHGLFLQNDQSGGFVWNKDHQVDISGAARTIKKITINGQENFIVGRNNGSPIFLKKTD